MEHGAWSPPHAQPLGVSLAVGIAVLWVSDLL